MSKAAAILRAQIAGGRSAAAFDIASMIARRIDRRLSQPGGSEPKKRKIEPQQLLALPPTAARVADTARQAAISEAITEHIHAMSGFLTAAYHHLNVIAKRAPAPGTAAALRGLEDALDHIAAICRLYRGDLSAGSVDLGTIIESVVTQVAAAHAGIRIRTHVPTGPTRPSVPTEIVTALVAQLTLNAAEAIRYGGLGRHAPDLDGADILVVASSADGTVRIEVADRGPGIPDTQLAAIWRRGFSAGKPSGLGLGLAQVRDWTEAAGGLISLTTGPGAGARFAIALPDRPLPDRRQKTETTQ